MWSHIAWVNCASCFSARFWFKPSSSYLRLKVPEGQGLKIEWLYITRGWQDCKRLGEPWSRMLFAVLHTPKQVICFWCPTDPLLPNKVTEIKPITTACMTHCCYSLFWIPCSLDRVMQCVNNQDISAGSGFVTQVGCVWSQWNKWWLTCFQMCIWTNRAKNTETRREAITWWTQSTKVHTDFSKLYILISSRAQSYLGIIATYSSAVGCLRKRPFTVSVRYSA